MRYKLDQNSTPHYSFFSSKEDLDSYQATFEKLFTKYIDLYNTLVMLKWKSSQGTLDDFKKAKQELWEFLQSQTPDTPRQNVVKVSQRVHTILSHGKDSNVYDIENWYVMKKSTLEASKENLEYFQHKYMILKYFLWDIIPKSYFILWDAKEKFSIERNFKNSDLNIIKTKIITLQRKIKGKTLQDMSLEEKKDPVFLQKLQQAHKRYILLKIFLQKFQSNIPKNDQIDIKLDIGWLSDLDSFPTDDMRYEKYLNSPNIMWDGEKIYFIDFDFWEWNSSKQSIYEKFVTPENKRDFEKFLH